MVNINFFKKLFSREPEQQAIPAIELEDWLANYSEKMLSPINKEILTRIEDVRQHIASTKEKLTSLEGATLINTKVSPREMHIMQGNRLSYLKRVDRFLSSIEIPELDYGKLLFFTNWFDHELDELNKSTIKSYYVLKNFFEKEAYDIAQSIKSMEVQIKTLNNLVASKEISLTNDLRSKIKDLNKIIMKNSSLTNEVTEYERELQQIEKRKDSLKEKLELLKTSRDFEEYNKLEREKHSTNNELKEIKIELSKRFLIMQRALKKFRHSDENAKLIDDYLKDPLNAIMADSSFLILNELDKIRRQISKGEISLKDQNKKKILNELEKINKGYMNKTLEKINSLNEDRSQLNSRIEKQTIMMDFKEMEYQMEHLNKKLVDSQREIKLRKDELAGLNLDDIKQKLEAALSEFTGIDITIKMS